MNRYDFYIPQVGETVRVKHFDHPQTMPDGVAFTKRMQEYCGQEFCVTYVYYDRERKRVYISNDNDANDEWCMMSGAFGGYFFTSYMIEPVAEPLNNIDFSNLI